MWRGHHRVGETGDCDWPATLFPVRRRRDTIVCVSVYDDLPTPAAGLLRQARHEARLTQAELAGRAGVPRSMISAYERDERQPTIATLLRLLKAAGFELRMHLAPYDDHDDVLAARRAAWPAEDQARWEAHHRARIEAGLATLRADERRLARRARR